MDKEVIARVVSEVERIARGVGFGQVTIVIEKGRPRWLEAGTREWLEQREGAPPGRVVSDSENVDPSAVQGIPGVVSENSRPLFCCPPRLTLAHVGPLYATLPNRTVKVHFGSLPAEALARLSAVQNY